MTEPVLNTAPRWLTAERVLDIEKKYNARFVLEVESPYSTMDVTGPMAVFYTKEKHPEGSNWFGITYAAHIDAYVILDALPHLPETVTGSKFADGMYYHSTYRHDYFVDPDEPSRIIDGGQSYTRTGNPIDLHEFNTKDLICAT